MRRIDNIVLHCTATPTNTTVASILRYWRVHLGWRNPGYHFIILRNGNVQLLHPIDKVSNGVRGHNANSIHISYIGGVDKHKRPIDNRTPAQIESQYDIVRFLKKLFPEAEVKGHRDFKGVKKDCPSFDARKWWSQIQKLRS